MLAQRQTIVASIRRDAWVEVDLAAIERNIGVARSWLSPGTQLMAVVKSDAYGHGALAVADVAVASGADWLGVASVDEGCQLRAAGIKQPVLLLSPCPYWALQPALEADLTITITDAEQVVDLGVACSRSNRTANVHLKIDSGMHRLGIDPLRLEPVLKAISRDSAIRLSGVFTHFASADEKEFTDFQTSVFKEALNRIVAAGFNPALIHAASGDAARSFPDTHFNMVRVGLLLYGLEARSPSRSVTPAMAVRGRINHIGEIAAGQTVGYSRTWTAARPSRIASIPIGYADGVDRGLSNRMTGLVLGHEVPQVGLISMDQMLFDITDVDEAAAGDIITLIGTESGTEKQLHLATWAAALDTITYELACRLRCRMPRVYTRNNPPLL